MRGLLTLIVSVVLAGAAPAQADRAAKWGKEVEAIRARLAAAPPKPGSIAFAGSSSFRLWDTAKAFADLDTFNVGFGGSEVRDTTEFAAKLLTPFKPSRVVLYAGDNDLASGRAPEQLRDDFVALVQVLRAADGAVKIDFVAVKPSPARWKLYDKQVEANRLVREHCAQGTGLGYLDIVPAMLGQDGQPKPELYRPDKLHLTPAGYATWEATFRAAWKPKG